MILYALDGLLRLLLAGLLLWAAVGDMRRYLIPNRLCILIALLAIPFWGVLAKGDLSSFGTIILWQMGIGAVLFAVGALLFYLNAWGGGDAKLLAALGLWIPLNQIANMLIVMSISGFVLAIIWWVRARFILKQRTPITLPYGVAIAMGGLNFACQPFLNMLFA
jgi:prepilin peptidase CpaA